MTTYDHNPNQAPAVADEWTPVLKGDVFCSPACGGNCKKAEYDQAVKAANELAAILGAGWEPDVWENLGWHYRAIKQDSEVGPEHGGYHAIIRIDDTFSISKSDRNAKKALAAAVGGLQLIHKKTARALASLSPDFNETEVIGVEHKHE